MIVLPVEKKIDWKRPPIVLFILLLLNVLIFAFYQSGDAYIMDEAYLAYEDANLVEIEALAYEAYQQPLEFDQRVPADDVNIAWHMMMDDDFFRFIQKNQSIYIDSSTEKKWLLSRDKVQNKLDQLSHLALGLNTDRVNIITVITHQFLHGDIMHLIGNMVFLLITGFAVEAALGHVRFLAYYLISGISAGLLFVGFHKLGGGANESLVGASGSISGVMAMYLTLFKMRKIEFFYWLFIFTGYFRAAAIIILPTYILKELIMHIMYADSNVAYTAHIGGFVGGLLLVLATQRLTSESIDTNYIDGVEAPHDPYQKHLHKLYQEIGNCEFRIAWTTLQTLKKGYKNKPELRDIEFNLIRALNRKKANQYLIDSLDATPVSRHIIKAQIRAWQKLDKEQQSLLSFSKKSALIVNCLTIDVPQVADKIFSGIEIEEGLEADTASLAQRIAQHYQSMGRSDIADKHRAVSKRIMENALKPAEGLS